MRARHALTAAAVIGVAGTAFAMTPATAAGNRHPHTITITAVEKGTSINFVDVTPADSALGDQLIGTGGRIRQRCCQRS